MFPDRQPAQTLLQRADQIDGEVARLTGAINAAHGRLVQVVRVALDEDLAGGPGLHSPAHWLAWKAGMSPGRARDLVKLAERIDELPAAVEALSAGQLTMDQAAQIARHVPASYDESVTEFAKVATVSQLRRALPDYGYEAPEAKPKDSPRPEYSVSMGEDDRGWWLNAHLPLDQGALLEKALQCARDDLYREEVRDLPPSAPRPSVSLLDAFVAMAESVLHHGAARRPGSDRYLVHLHLDTGLDGTSPQLTRHLGRALPAWMRRLITCDAKIRAVAEHLGIPLSVGRSTRNISRRLRRAIERRDGGCAAPGCHRTWGLEIHHIIHWEDGGPTDTNNLVCLCAGHHRLHHQGLLAITGDANRGLAFIDGHGRTLEPMSRPSPDSIQESQQPYLHPVGERLDLSQVHFSAAAPSRAGPARV